MGEPPLPEALGALQVAVQSSRLEARFAGGIGNAAASPDGSLLVTDSLDPETSWATGEVVVRDAINGDPIRTLIGASPVVKGENREDGGGGGRAFAFSPDGRLAVAYETNPESSTMIVIWDPATGSEISELDVPGWASWDPTWSADGSHLAAASWDGTIETVTVWQVESGQVVAAFQSEFVGRIAFYDQETLAVTHGPQQIVGFYDLGSGAQVDLLETPGLDPLYMAIDQTGQRLAVAARHQTLQVWDLEARTLSWSRPVTSKRELVISPDGVTVALAGDEGRVELFDLDDGAEILELSGHVAGIWGAAFSPNGERLYTAGTDGETRIWDVSPGGSPALGAIEIETGLPFLLEFSPDGRELAASTWSGTLERRATDDGRLLGLAEGFLADAPLQPVLNQGWEVFAAVDTEGVAAVYDLDSGEPIQQLPACTNPRALSPDGSAVALDGLFLCGIGAATDVELRSRVVEVSTEAELLDLGGRAVFRAAFNPGSALPTGRYLAVNITNGNEQTVEVYDLVSGEMVASLELYPTHIRFDPTGQYLVSESADGTVAVLDLVAVVEGTAVDEALVFHQTVATGAVPGLALSSTGILATSAFDSPIIRLWDIHSGELVAEIRTGLDGASPPHLAFSSEGEYLLYPDANQVLRKFYLDPERLISLALSRVTRELTEEECLRYLDESSCG
ncbi:MAG TPA: WD40 repeat domain-containing protein [Acidimicrobiia bacterium]|nr:WD40 repeat domain-containing protein [Acidimicrobiia bacterium]